MKKIILFYLLLLNSVVVFSQEYPIDNGTINACSGTFTDSGGSAGNYGNNESFVFTICPEEAGQLVQLDFTVFNTQLNVDTMTIYDGDDTTANAFGTFNGTTNPGFVTATPNNTSGCLTIEFTTNDSATTTGWEATISCFEPCQTIVSQLDSASPAPNGDGYIRVCPDEEITLTGSGQFSVDGTGATYQWDLGDGNTVDGQTATFSYSTPGVYIVNLNIRDTNTSSDPDGCANTNLINQVIQVATEPDFTGTEAADPVICYGESTTIDGVVNAVDFINDCTPPVSGTTFLPDGSGAVYTTCITVDCYDSSQTLDDISQLIDICVNMEHSFLGDLEITIISPNGQEAILKDYPGGGGTYLGGANDDGSTTPGVGADYCFSMSGAVTLVNGPTITAGTNPPGNSITPGTYLPEGSFNTLLGSPLNGDWCIEIIDNLSIDNGYVFSWGLEFDPAIQPPELSFTPVITSESWDPDASIVNTTGNTITVQPATAGTHCYTYRVTDDFGCEYTEEVCIEVLPEIIHEVPNNLSICDTGAPPYIFDLTENEGVVLGTNPNPTDFVVTFHNSLADAENDTGAIDAATAAAYSGTDGEVIFVRIEYLTSDCYEIESFTLDISAQPVINPVPDMVVCDDDSNDGIAEFDLTTQDLGILGIQLPTEYTVTYYANFADADAGTGALVSPYMSLSINQPIFVRVEATGSTSCYIASPNPVFNLVVDYQAIANAVPDMELCDDDLDGFVGFDLESQTAGVLGAQDGTLFTVTYHESAAEAAAGTGALTSLYTNTSNNQVIHVRIEENANPVCYGITTFELIVNPLPAITPVTPLEECDTDADGFAEFMLEEKNDEVLNGQTDIAVSYYETLADAVAGTGAITGPYTNIVINTQTVFIRLENGITGCVSTTQMDLVVNPLPIPIMPPALEVCDDDNDGFAMFDFTGIDAIVIGTQTGMIVTYHDTFANADNEGGGIAPLGTTYTNINPNTQDIFIRLENATTGCHAVTTMQLIVHPLPTVGVIENYELCDYDNPGDEIEIFDLTTMDAEIANGQNVTVSYYESLANAESGTSPIVGPYTNTSNPQTIFAQLSNNGTGCISIATFDLVVNPLPILIDPTPLEVCDDNVPDGITEIDLTLKDDEIRGGNPDYAITYYETLADAIAEQDQLPSLYTNLFNNQVIFVRGEDINTGCFSTTSLELVVEQAPVATVPTPLEYCDADADGFGEFMLTDAEAEIIGVQVGLIVTYHETMADADNNVNPLASPYNNIVVHTQTVYARVESVTIATDCATIVPLVLNVYPEPQIELNPSALEVCDDNTDEIATFDLTLSETEILNGIDPTLVTVSYYATEANAEAATSPIVVPTSHTNITNPDSVWVRVEFNATGCYKVVELGLIVNPLPVLVQPSPLELCDVNNSGDEIEEFTLEDSVDEILNGQTGISITFYETQADADAGTNQVFSPYTNTSVGGNPHNPQTLYVRAENDITGCVSTITLDLRVNPIPTPATPNPLEVCDDDNDGFIGFNLESATPDIINNEADISVTYHETMADAESDSNALVSPYENIVANTQTVYARAENDITGCFTIVELQLVVLPSPVVPLDIDDYVICDDDNNGITQFDLTTMDAVIYGTQDPTLFNLTYHLTEADADSGDDPIINVGNYTNASNPQTIYVRLESVTNGCVSTGEFDLVVEFPPVPVQPPPLEICDDDYYAAADEIATFDLTLKNDEITGGNASWMVTYYETNADAQADTNAIDPADAYMNTAVDGNPHNPQTLYVRVTDTNTGCYAFTTLTIRVLPNPTPNQDVDNIELCDDTGTADGQEIFDLTVNELSIISGEAGVTATYYETQADAEAGSNAIANPSGYINTNIPVQTIYVRVTNDVTGCYTIVTFDVIVNPLPIVDTTVITDFIACEANTDVYEFDLESKTTEILNGQDPAIFEVTYHETLADAQAAQNAVVSPYTNTSNPQAIYVNITNTVTGCDIAFFGFLLRVDEPAVANGDGFVYELCDDNVETDGDPTNDTTQFDLPTVLDPQVLGAQDPASYIVSYYSSLTDAEQAINALPTLYDNVVNTQVIYARVDNNTEGVIAISLNLSTLTNSLDVNADGVDDTYDTDGDGAFDLLDVNGDGVSDGIDVEGDGDIDYIDLDGDGIGDAVDLNNDGNLDDNLGDSSECYDIASVTLQVNPLPIIDLQNNYLLCIPDDHPTAIVDSPVIDPGLSDTLYDFEWLDASGVVVSTDPIFEPTAGGAYTLVVTDTSTSLVTMCQSTFNFTVDVSSPPVIDMAQTTTTTLYFAGNHEVLVTATGLGDYEFSLDEGPWTPGMQASNVWTHTFTDVTPGYHTVYVRDMNGCGYEEYEVLVVDYPLYFTPNGDGYNDTWKIEGIDTVNNVKIYIFDRYGKLLKQLSPAGNGWNGTYNGSLMPSSDYWFVIEYEEGGVNKEFKAHFTLKR
jgi:gliding motility-associated-like protein